MNQPKSGASSNDTERRFLFQTTRRTISYRSLLLSLNETQYSPTPNVDDSTVAITQVLNDRLTPQVKHIDVLVTWMNKQFFRKRLRQSHVIVSLNK